MKRRLLFLLATLCVVTACGRKADTNYGSQADTRSDGPTTIPVTISSLQWECAGGGGIRQCKVKNMAPQAVGPFDVEFQTYDQDRHMLGPATASIPSLGAGEEHEFTLTSSTRTVRVTLQRVIPR